MIRFIRYAALDFIGFFIVFAVAVVCKVITGYVILVHLGLILLSVIVLVYCIVLVPTNRARAGALALSVTVVASVFVFWIGTETRVAVYDGEILLNQER